MNMKNIEILITIKNHQNIKEIRTSEVIEYNNFEKC